MLYPPPQGPLPSPEHRPAAVDDGGPEVWHKLVPVSEPGHGPVQAEEGVLDHVLSAGLIAQQELCHPDQADRMIAVEIVDKLAGLPGARPGRGELRGPRLRGRVLPRSR